MLSSKPIGAGGAGGAAAYYENLAREDYYTHGGEPPGRWVGRHAERLGLQGNVEKGQLGAALRGFDPRTGEALAANAGDAHHGGYDLTFSAPKSVSVVWSAADLDTRKLISEAQQKAVESALAKAERDGAFGTSRGHAWAERVAYKDGVVAATFEHSTSRNGDPQLHTHAIVSNITPDGRRLDFDTSAKVALGTAYRAELASELQKMGFKIEADKSSFRVVGVDKNLESEMSTRRAEILAALKERGLSGGKASAVAALATREKKGEVDREQLFAKAQLVAESYGLNAERINEMRRSYTTHGSEMPTHEEMLAKAYEQASTLTPRQLEAAILREAQGKIGLEDAEKYAAELLASEHIVELRDSDGGVRYTSNEMYEIERGLHDSAVAMSLEKTHAVDDQAREFALATRTLSDEQQKALAHITGAERIAVVEGVAGAGKSYMLDAARETWERSGYRVIGTAVAGKAAEGLQSSAGIESGTMASLLKRLDEEKTSLDSKTIVVIDEGGMVGSRQMQRLQAHIDAAGAKLVVVGETLQAQPIDAGGAMRAQIEACGKHFEMREIRRQQSAEERKAGQMLDKGAGAEERAMVMDARAGNYKAVFDHLEANDRLREYADRDELRHAMAATVVSDLAAGKSALGFVETNADTRAINTAAREAMRGAGMLTGDDKAFRAVVEKDGVKEGRDLVFAAGDRVIFLKNSHDLGVKNGTTGAVEKAGNGRLVVRLDDSERKVDVKQADYAAVAHGYAITVHKGQGVTVDRACYAPGQMAHRELAYVALSRHRETGADGVRMFVTAEQLADRKALVAQMSKSEAKFSSTAFQKIDSLENKLEAAEQREAVADREVEKIADAIEKARFAETKREISAGAHNQFTTTKEIQNESRNDRYAGIDPARMAASRGAAASLRERNGAEHAPGRPAESVHAMRNLPGIAVVQQPDKIRRGSNEVSVQAHERDNVAVGRGDDHELRRAGTGDREVNRSDVKAVNSPQIERLERQLAQAQAEREKAAEQVDKLAGQRDAARAALLAKAAEPPSRERRSALEKNDTRAAVQRLTGPAPKSERAIILRDGELAKKALESHKHGDKLPPRDKLERQVEAGKYVKTYDSSGKQYLVREKDGKVFSRDLNKADLRQTKSANLQHFGLTSTKYAVVDKKVMGIKVGTTVIKSGGTLTSEAAGAARDGLRALTKSHGTMRAAGRAAGVAAKAAAGKANKWELKNGAKNAGKAVLGTVQTAARIVTKPADYLLSKGEGWKKAGVVESLGARVQMKLEQRQEKAAAIKDLEAKAKAAEKLTKLPNDAAKTIDAAKIKEASASRSSNTERGAAADAARVINAARSPDRARNTERMPASPGAELAKDLATREPPDRARSTERIAERQAPERVRERER